MNPMILNFLNTLASQSASLGSNLAGAVSGGNPSPDMAVEKAKEYSLTPQSVGGALPSQVMGATYSPAMADAAGATSSNGPVAGMAAPPVNSKAGVDPETGTPLWLIGSESGGDWSASNSVRGAGGLVGHGGRAQFGQARFQDAKNAGAVPRGMSFDEFKSGSEASVAAQKQAERWHWADIDRAYRNDGASAYEGQIVGGVPINASSFAAMAHLGGAQGAKRFIQSGGAYNPDDSNGTRLSDYGRRATDSTKAGLVGSYSSKSVAPNPWEQPENVPEETWEPKNWRERVLGVKPTSSDDDSAGAERYRQSGAMFVGLGQGLSQMSHGQPVDISQSFEQFSKQRLALKGRMDEIRERQQTRQDNAQLYDSLDEDLKPLAQSEKGLNAAIKVMTDRMSAEPSPVADTSVVEQMQTRAPELVQAYTSNDPDMVKQATEAWNNIVQFDYTRPEDSAEKLTANSLEKMPAEQRQRIIDDANAVHPGLGDQIGAGITDALLTYNDIARERLNPGVGRAKPEEVSGLKRSVDAAFPGESNQATRELLYGMAEGTPESIQELSGILSTKIGDVATGRTTARSLIMEEYAGIPGVAAAASVSGPEGLQTALDLISADTEASIKKIRDAPTVAGRVLAIQDYDQRHGTTFSAGLDADSTSEQLDAASQGIMERDQATHQSILAQSNQENAARVEIDRKNKEAAMQEVRDEAKKNMALDALATGGMAPEMVDFLRGLPLDQVVAAANKAGITRLDQEFAAEDKLAANQASADAMKHLYGKEGWWSDALYKSMIKDPTQGTKLVDMLVSDSQKTAERMRLGQENEKLAETLRQSGPNGEYDDLATLAEQGQSDKAVQAYLQRTGGTSATANYRFGQSLPVEERPDFWSKVATANGAVDPAQKAALEVKVDHFKKKGEVIAGLDGRIAKLQLAMEIMQQPQYSSGPMTDAMVTPLSFLREMGIDIAPGNDVNLTFQAVAKSLIPEMRVAGSGSTSDLEFKSFEKSIFSLGKSPEANKLIAYTNMELAKRAQARFDAELEYFGNYGVKGNPSVSEEDYVQQRLIGQGMGGKVTTSFNMVAKDQQGNLVPTSSEDQEKMKKDVAALALGAIYTVTDPSGKVFVLTRGVDDQNFAKKK